MAIVLPASWAQTPGNRDRSALRRDILRYVKSPDDPEAAETANDGINNAIRQLNMRSWHWAIKTKDITLAADDGTYSLAAAFKAPFQATFLDTNGNEALRVEWEDPKTFHVRFRDNAGITGAAFGAGYYYTAYNSHKDGIVTVYPKPSASSVTTYPTMRTQYYSRTNTLVRDSDRLDAPSEVENFVTWTAKAYIASVYGPKLYALATAEANKAWKMLIRDDNESGFTDWSDS